MKDQAVLAAQTVDAAVQQTRAIMSAGEKTKCAACGVTCKICEALGCKLEFGCKCRKCFMIFPFLAGCWRKKFSRKLQRTHKKYDSQSNFIKKNSSPEILIRLCSLLRSRSTSPPPRRDRRPARPGTKRATTAAGGRSIRSYTQKSSRSKSSPRARIAGEGRVGYRSEADNLTFWIVLKIFKLFLSNWFRNIILR